MTDFVKYVATHVGAAEMLCNQSFGRGDAGQKIPKIPLGALGYPLITASGTAQRCLGNDGRTDKDWVLAFAGMTRYKGNLSDSRCDEQLLYCTWR